MVQKLLELKTGTSLKNKQEWLREEILENINNGVYSGQLPSLKELSKEYNANIITIQKSLRPLVTEGLLTAKRGRGIYINGKRHLCIGITGEPSKEYFFDERCYGGAVFKHVLSYIQEKGDFFSYHEKTGRHTYGQIFRGNSAVDGLIIVAPSADEREDIESLRIPYLVVGSAFPGSSVNYVDSDNEADSEKAVARLIREGYARIALVHGIYGNDVTVDMRIRGYRKALEKHGIGYSPDMVIDVGEGEEVFEKKLHFLLNAKAAAPDAIFGACFHAAKKLFDRLPREFLKNRGIIVYDDHRRELKALGIPYCIVSQPLERIGKAAIEGLYELLRENQEPIQICFPSQIVEMR